MCKIFKVAYCVWCGNETLYRDCESGQVYCNNCNDHLSDKEIKYRDMRDTEEIVYKPKTK